MLEITKKKIVKTRKEHECFACLQAVGKEENAIAVSAKEDEQRMRFHLHLDCNKTMAKKGMNVERGCLAGGIAVECKYCDMGFPAMLHEEMVCGSCGAEWIDARITVQNEDYIF